VIGCSETRTVSAQLVLNAAVHDGVRELEFSSVQFMYAVNEPSDEHNSSVAVRSFVLSARGVLHGWS